MSNTPSKAEIEVLVKRHGATSYRNRADTQHPAYGFTEDGLNGLIDEVLAKWGSPQPVAREPSPPAPDCGSSSGGKTPRANELEAARLSMKQTRTPAYGDALKLCRRLETELQQALSAVQQPVVREPLTDEQLAAMMRETWGCASIAPRHALEFARAVERAHGITKGGSNAE